MSYYNRQGEPITVGEWMLSGPEVRRVAVAQIGDVRVSTIWLGLDHQYGAGPPLIFETMVFNDALDDEHDERDCERYSTEAEAVAGHAEWVAKVRAGGAK